MRRMIRFGAMMPATWGVFGTVDAISPVDRAALARAPLAEQMTMIEELYAAKANGYAALTAAQAGTVLRRTELTYDLMLGGDITSPGISGEWRARQPRPRDARPSPSRCRADAGRACA